MKTRWAGALGCALAMLACGQRDTSAPAAEVSLSKDLPKRAPLTFAQYAPLVREVGTLGAIPTSIVIELAAPAATKQQLGRSVETGFQLTPALPGALRWTAPSQLTFTPDAPGFAPDVAYKVELRHLETAEGVVPAPTPIAHTFTTPAFAFAGAAPVAFDPAAKKATVEVRFTGPVAPTAPAALELTIDGKAPVAVTFAPNPRNAIVAEVASPSLAVGSVIGVASRKGVSGASGGASGPIAARYTIGKERPATVVAAQLVEGSSGFYLEVTCNDTAAPAGSHGTYIDDEVVKLSQRCQLSDDALARVHLDPPVKKMYLTSGRTGFRVFGELRRGAYAIKIDAGATTRDGGIVAASWGKTFTVPLRTPKLELAGSGRYLPRSAWSRLGVRHMNVDAAKLVVRRVPPENLAFYMSADHRGSVDERTSDIILDHTVPLPGAGVDATGTTWVDIARLVPATTRGILEVRVVGVAAEAASQLLLTDLSLVAKKTAPPDKPAEQTVHVWALGMADAAPATGVDVSLVRKSGTVVARCTTGADGCTLVAKSPDADPAVPFAIVARRGDDITYLRYADLRVELGGTSGVANDRAPYRAAVYGDRGLYRPGETAHVVAIVHDTRGVSRAPEAPLPVDIEVFDPRAKIARRIAHKTNAAGLVAFEHALPAFAETGLWRVVVSVAGQRLATHHLQVEEFVPERMRVSVTPVRAEALMGEAVELDVSAQYLFGGSAIDSGVRVQCELSPAVFSPKHNADLAYGVRPRGRSVPLPEAKDQLDPRGVARIACPAPPPGAALAHTARLSANVSVEEAGSGRATTRQASALLHPERYYLGLKGGAPRASAGVPFTVEGTIVGWDGLPLASGAPETVDVELLRLEHDYGYSNDADDDTPTHFDRATRITSEKKQRVTVAGGVFRIAVTPAEAEAGYVVRASAGRARTELVLPGGPAEEIDPEEVSSPAGAGQLAVDLPSEIRAGQDVTVTVRAPYRGKLLWSLETDRVIASAWREVPAAGAATWSFRLPAFAPNVYVTALLVKDPHAESSSAFLPERAYGIASARVAPVDFTQPLAITAPKEVRSGGALSIALDAGPLAGPGFATVAVVDEGILSLTGHATPDPLAQLFARRELGVETYETIGWTMLHRPAGVAARTGGGDGGAEGGKLAGTRIRPTKPVALFSGVVPIGADGKVSVPFQLPAYRGKVRVMAIVATPTRIGRAEASVTVRDPLIAQVTFPRFVTLGDELDIPVFVTNMSGGPLEVDVTATAAALDVPGLARPPGAPFALTPPPSSTVKIEDGRSETVVFHARALHAVGGAKLRVVARARGLEVRDEVDVPFLPAGARERIVARTRVAAGPLELASQPALAGWVPTSERTTFWMTSNPYAESLQHLSYLSHYPYGCIEQTVSSARPLLYLGDLARDAVPQIAPQDLVQAGIQRVLSMETPSGGFGYWPGASEPLAWATAYAADFLLDAKKAGYPVPEDRLTEVLAWVEARVGKYERGEVVSAGKPVVDEQAEAYLHLVLAKSGRARKARIARLLEGIPDTATGAATEDRYVLQAALWLAGDRRFDKQLRSVDASPIAAERGTGTSFYSDRRRRGLVLSVFHDLFGNDPAGEPLAARVAESLAGSSAMYTTQELAWGITGLGKWVAGLSGKKATAGTAGGTLRADGAAIAPRSGAPGSWTVARASEYKSLALEVPASAAGMWLVTTSEGVRASPPRLGGRNLAVKRTYRKLDGTEVDLSTGALRLGDIVFVEVALENTTAARISNLALVDRLPAGFEIENARLGRSIALAWAKDADQWTLDHMNVRDDHLEAFGALGPKEKRVIVYAIRAVTAGTFAVPPVEAEAMYDPSTWARAAGGKAVVGGPWTARTL